MYKIKRYSSLISDSSASSNLSNVGLGVASEAGIEGAISVVKGNGLSKGLVSGLKSSIPGAAATAASIGPSMLLGHAEDIADEVSSYNPKKVNAFNPNRNFSSYDPSLDSNSTQSRAKDSLGNTGSTIGSIAGGTAGAGIGGVTGGAIGAGVGVLGSHVANKMTKNSPNAAKFVPKKGKAALVAGLGGMILGGIAGKNSGSQVGKDVGNLTGQLAGGTVGGAIDGVRKQYSVVGVAKDVGKYLWKHKGTVGGGMAMGAAMTGGSYLADKMIQKDMKNSVSTSINGQGQKTYSIGSIIKKTGTKLVSGINSMSGGGGIKGMKDFGNYLSNSSNSTSRKLGKWIGDHSVASTAIATIPVAIGTAKAFDIADKTTKSALKSVDKNAFKYTEMKEKELN